MMVDEADIDLVGGSSSGSNTNRVTNKRPISSVVSGDAGIGIVLRGPPKRKPGPLPPHFTARRPTTPIPTPPSSPAPPIVISDVTVSQYVRSPELVNAWSHPTNGEIISPVIDNVVQIISDMGTPGNMFSQIASYQPLPANLTSLPPVVKPLLNGGKMIKS